jgi:hypothetical protein
MEAHPSVYRASNAVLVVVKEVLEKGGQTLLGNKELPRRVENELYRLGIEGSLFLLVYQRDILHGADTRQLERKDDGLSHV